MIELKTRFATEEELTRRYGKRNEDFYIVPGIQVGQPIVKVYPYRSTDYVLQNLTAGQPPIEVHPHNNPEGEFAITFPRWLPVNECGETIDPLSPTFNGVSEYEKNGLRVRTFTRSGLYLDALQEFRLFTNYQNSKLSIFEVCCMNDSMPPGELLSRVGVKNGHGISFYEKLSDDKKYAKIYVVASCTKKLKDLTIELEV